MLPPSRTGHPLPKSIDDLNTTVSFALSKGSTSPARGAICVKVDGELKKMNTLDLGNEKLREKFLDGLAADGPPFATDAAKETLRQQLLEIAAEAVHRREMGNQPVEDKEENQPLAKSKAALVKTDSRLVELAKEFLRATDLIKKIIDHVHLLGVAGEDELIATTYVIGTSRLLENPLAGIVMGSSSAGRSYVVNKTSTLFPDEAVLRAHQITPKALQYLQGYGSSYLGPHRCGAVPTCGSSDG